MQVGVNESRLPARTGAGAASHSVAPASDSHERVFVLASGETLHSEDGLFSNAEDLLPSDEVQPEMDPAVRAKHERFMREALAQVSPSMKSHLRPELTSAG